MAEFEKNGKAFFATIQLPPEQHEPKERLRLGRTALMAYGVPERKVDRVLLELQKQVDADPSLNKPLLLRKLALELAGLFW